MAMDKEREALVDELDGVIADCEVGNGFDDVCLRTIKRVRDALAAQQEPVNAEGQEKNESPGSRSETLARNADAGEKSQGENSGAPVPSAPTPLTADGVVSREREIENICRRAIGSIGSFDRSLQQHYESLLAAAKEPRK